ncbi:MAG: hypothetical protein U1A78_32210 [Polyangia bacterium]
MLVKVLRSVKLGEDVVGAGETREVDDADVRRHPDLFRPVQQHKAAEAQREAAAAQQTEERYSAHMALRDRLVHEEADRQRAEAELLARQADARSEVARAARRQMEAPRGDSSRQLLEPPDPAAPRSPSAISPAPAPAAPLPMAAPAAPAELPPPAEPPAGAEERPVESAQLPPHLRRRE